MNVMKSSRYELLQIEIPKFTVPKAKQYGRTGSGERHRPHKFIKAVSVPLAVLLMAVAAGSVVLTFWKTFGKDAPVNYSTAEILAARSWYDRLARFEPTHSFTVYVRCTLRVLEPQGSMATHFYGFRVPVCTTKCHLLLQKLHGRFLKLYGCP